ncbi:FAD/NAD(P)-binding protein [bacterium]|nr:FAD/NAD(P)-binding protein [bacterium]
MAEIMTEPMVTIQYRVLKIKRETHDTFALDIEPASKKAISSFTPGQFNMLYAFGKGEVPISISSDPATPEKLVHTIRAVGAVTKSLCKLNPGSVIGVRGPFGTGWPLEQAEGNDIVMVTGGIGLAPLRPAIYHLLANRDKYGKVILLYGARSPSEMLYRKQLEQWGGRFDFDVGVTVDSARADWHGNVALVTTLISNALFDPYSTTAFVCGPEVMMRYTLLELQKRGVADDNIYISMERNMKCGIGHCGHCQFGPYFICKDGPIFCMGEIREFFERREV